MLLSRLNLGELHVLTRRKNRKLKRNYLPCSYFYYEDFEDSEGTAQHWGLLNTIRGKFNKVLSIHSAITVGRRAVLDWDIDLLVSVSSNTVTVLSTYLLAKLEKKPYVVYLFDLYNNNRQFFIAKIFASFFEPAFLKNASAVIVTNEGTRKYYEKKYGKKVNIEVIHNSVSSAPYMAVRGNQASKTQRKIIYTGNVNWPQLRSLRSMLEAVDTLKGVDVGIDLYVPNSPIDLLRQYDNHKKINFKSAPQSVMAEIQTKADILFLPLSWNTPAPDIIRTASPGKLTDYLIAGRPILIHAPPYSYVCSYAQEYGFAHIVSEENTAKLQEGIIKILNDKMYSQELCRNARSLFFQNHEADSNAQKLTRLLQGV